MAGTGSTTRLSDSSAFLQICMARCYWSYLVHGSGSVALANRKRATERNAKSPRDKFSETSKPNAGKPNCCAKGTRGYELSDTHGRMPGRARIRAVELIGEGVLGSTAPGDTQHGEHQHRAGESDQEAGHLDACHYRLREGRYHRPSRGAGGAPAPDS